MRDVLDFPAIQQRIAESNRNAVGNQNQYPIQEQATLQEIWEYVPCTCDGNKGIFFLFAFNRPGLILV